MKATTRARIATAIGIILLVISTPILMVAVRDLTRMARFAGKPGHLNEAITYANLGYFVFDGSLVLVFAGIGLYLLRPHLRKRNAVLIGGAVAVAAVILGIMAGNVGRA